MADATVTGLNRLGWRITDQASWKRSVAAFQRGYALPGRPALLVDGNAGPKTRAAVAECVARLKAGKPTASKYFSFSEFTCKCGGRYKGCHRILVHRGLLIGLDELRDAVRKPITIVSGYRCPTRNEVVGGATKSEHVDGAAADLEYVCTTRVAQRLRRFSGIGHKGGKVRHVDVRHLSGSNLTGGTPDRPTIWTYGA